MKKGQSQNRLLHVESAAGIPVVTVTGTPRALGTSLGERLRPRLAVLIQDVLQELCRVSGDNDLIDEGGGFRQDRAEQWLRDHLAHSGESLRAAEPGMWMELESMAEACEIDVVFLLAITAYNDLLDRFSREQAFFESEVLLLQPEHSSLEVPLLAMDWSVPPYLLPHLVLVRRIPAHGPATLNLSLGGLHTVAGISASGLAAASNDLRDAVVESTGLPTPLMVQLSLSSSTYEDAVAKLQRQDFMGSRAIHLLSRDRRRVSIEISGRDHHELAEPFARMPRVHTNHRLHEGAPGDVSGSVRWSQRRLQRLARSIANCGDGIGLDEIDDWFAASGSGSEMIEAHHLRKVSREQPVSAAVAIMDPVRQHLHCHGGGRAGGFRAVSL